MATFKQVITQSLECPVCLNMFDQPKSLPCSHTFCEACLQRILEAQPDVKKLQCPICRKLAKVPEGGVCQLQLSFALNSLLEDIKNHSQNCTNCTREEIYPAVVFCEICNMYMCVSCEKTHSEWKEFTNHQVVNMNEVLSGKVPIQRRRQCQKHPHENEECFCIDCRHYVCFRCAMLEHGRDGHRVVEASEHETNHRKHIEELSSNADVTLDSLKTYIACVEKQRQRLHEKFIQINGEIEKAYKVSVQRLKKRKEELSSQFRDEIEKIDTKLKAMIDSTCQDISRTNAVKELVCNGAKVPLGKDAMNTHDTLCQELEEIVRREDPDYNPLRDVVSKGEKISFHRNQGINELGLGKLRGINFQWVLKTDSHLPVKYIMTAMAATPDGRMAVGGFSGGIHLFGTDGQLQQTVMSDVIATNVGFLSDDRWVVRDSENILSLYTPQSEKLDVRFETQSYEEGGFGDVTVGHDDQIYVTYRKMKIIQVFTMAGGKSIRNIPRESETRQIFALKSPMLLIREANNIACIDAQTGDKKYYVKKPHRSAWPAVCRDDSIIVAWVKHDEALVSIDHYTSELRHLRNLITDYNIETKEELEWYYLQEFQNGEVAFCTPDKLYIFHKIFK